MNYTQVGNTIRSEVQFNTGWGDVIGVPVDPTVIKFKVYDSRYRLIDDKSVGPAYRLGIGKYFYTWTPPQSSKVEDYIIEWYGEVEGLPTLKRSVLYIKFV